MSKIKVEKVTEDKLSEFDKKSLHPLQSWEWGEFRKKTGNIPYRFAEFEGNKLLNSYQLMLHRIPKTKFKIGTLIKSPMPTQAVFDFLKGFARKENVIFIKLEPALPTDSGKINHKNIDEEKSIAFLRKNQAVEGKTLFTPTTFWIDLTKTEEDLLKSFKSKTRYNVRYAKRKGVKVTENNSDKAFERYLELTKKTVERQGFYAHSEKYHRLMWKTLHADMVKKKKKPIARLLTAKHKKEILTTWIVFVWNNFLYYPYGASTFKHKNLQPNSLMMWEAILYGKKNGLKIFDLWGREPGKGFTHFKEGFSPELVKFLGTWDIPTSPLYTPYRLAEKVRWVFLRARHKLGLIKPSF